MKKFYNQIQFGANFAKDFRKRQNSGEDFADLSVPHELYDNATLDLSNLSGNIGEFRQACES